MLRAAILYTMLGLAAALGADDISLPNMLEWGREANLALELRLHEVPSAASLM
jgi:hypothetical protein